MSLILDRGLGHEVLIGNNAGVIVHAIKPGDIVSLGFWAPPGVPIDRREVREAKEQASPRLGHKFNRGPSLKWQIEDLEQRIADHEDQIEACQHVLKELYMKAGECLAVRNLR